MLYIVCWVGETVVIGELGGDEFEVGEQRVLEDERAEAFVEMRRSAKLDVFSSQNEPALPLEVQRHENAKEDVRRLIEDRNSVESGMGELT